MSATAPSQNLLQSSDLPSRAPLLPAGQSRMTKLGQSLAASRTSAVHSDDWSSLLTSSHETVRKRNKKDVDRWRGLRQKVPRKFSRRSLRLSLFATTALKSTFG